MRVFSLKSTPLLAGLAGVGLTCASAFAVRAEDDMQIAQMQGGPQIQRMGADGPRGMGPRGGGDRCERLAERLEKTDRHLTADQIHDILARRLAQSGEPNLKVGKTRAKGDVVEVDIVTTSGSLVTTREISMKTGLPANLLERCKTQQDQRIAQRGNDPRTDGDHGGGRPFQMRGGPGGPGGMGGGMGMGGMQGQRLGGGLTGALAMIAGEPGRDLKLTPDQGKKLAEAALVMVGNPRLKVGAVKEKDADTLTVEIVTQDNALVIRREMSRHTGRAHKAA